MKYTKKKKKLADQFRADGADEHLVNKFVREEMERDRYERNKGLTEIEAFQEWQSWTERDRQFFLNNALCPNCHLTSFAPDYTVRADSFGLIVEGTCSRLRSQNRPQLRLRGEDRNSWFHNAAL